MLIPRTRGAEVAPSGSTPPAPPPPPPPPPPGAPAQPVCTNMLERTSPNAHVFKFSIIVSLEPQHRRVVPGVEVGGAGRAQRQADGPLAPDPLEAERVDPQLHSRARRAGQLGLGAQLVPRDRHLD